jgi:hypothetical protein
LSGSWASAEILSKKDRRRHEAKIRRAAAPFVDKWVNLSLRDGSIISKVYLTPFPGKRLLRYSTAAGEAWFVPLADVDGVTAVLLEGEWLQGCS